MNRLLKLWADIDFVLHHLDLQKGLAKGYADNSLQENLSISCAAPQLSTYTAGQHSTKGKTYKHEEYKHKEHKNPIWHYYIYLLEQSFCPDTTLP